MSLVRKSLGHKAGSCGREDRNSHSGRKDQRHRALFLCLRIRCRAYNREAKGQDETKKKKKLSLVRPPEFQDVRQRQGGQNGQG